MFVRVPNRGQTDIHPPLGTSSNWLYLCDCLFFVVLENRSAFSWHTAVTRNKNLPYFLKNKEEVFYQPRGDTYVFAGFSSKTNNWGRVFPSA